MIDEIIDYYWLNITGYSDSCQRLSKADAKEEKKNCIHK